MDFKSIIYEKKEGIAFLTINRPEAGNSVDPETEAEIAQAWDDAARDENVRVGIMTGAGKHAFCTGMDTKAVAKRGYATGMGVCKLPIDFWKPIIMAVNGICAGGGWHYLGQADIPICSDNATFLEPHVSIGLMPLSEMFALADRAPLSVVLRMAFMGTKERLDAKRAYDLGIVTEVIPYDQLMSRATEIAKAITEQSPVAVACIKEALHRGYEYRFSQKEASDYGSLLRREVLGRSTDRIEGARAFAEKRKPKWQPYNPPVGRSD